MISIITNSFVVLQPLIRYISSFGAGNPVFENMLAKISSRTLEEMKNRIHKEGKAADGSAIGKYADKSKTGNVTLNSSGTLKDGFNVIPITNGFALGWEEQELNERAAALETRYGKTIWALTEQEEQHAAAAAQKLIADAFS